MQVSDDLPGRVGEHNYGHSVYNPPLPPPDDPPPPTLSDPPPLTAAAFGVADVIDVDPVKNPRQARANLHAAKSLYKEKKSEQSKASDPFYAAENVISSSDEETAEAFAIAATRIEARSGTIDFAQQVAAERQADELAKNVKKEPEDRPDPWLSDTRYEQFQQEQREAAEDVSDELWEQKLREEQSNSDDFYDKDGIPKE